MNRYFVTLSIFATALVWPVFSATHQAKRSKMVEQQIRARGISDEQVLSAFAIVPRHLFVETKHAAVAYTDAAVPIGQGQHMLPPYISAIFAQAAEIKPGDKVLEIGTGTGYLTTVLSHLAGSVYSMEILPKLAARAKKTLTTLDRKNITLRTGDGYAGWPEAAPFDAILVETAPDHIPQALKDQLKVGGRLVVPIGEDWQEVVRLTKTKDGFKRDSLLPVRLDSMSGEIRTKRKSPNKVTP